MTKSSHVLLALTLGIAVVPVASGQATAKSVAVTTPEPTQAQLAAARDLLRLMDMERVTTAGVETMLNAQFGQNPAAAAYLDVARAWAKKHLTWANMVDRMSRVYASTFTEPELRELVAFYRTPTGQKLASVTPLLMERGAAVGAELAEEHTADLQRMLEARQAELQAGTKTPKP